MHSLRVEATHLIDVGAMAGTEVAMKTTARAHTAAAVAKFDGTFLESLRSTVRTVTPAPVVAAAKNAVQAQAPVANVVAKSAEQSQLPDAVAESAAQVPVASVPSKDVELPVQAPVVNQRAVEVAVDAAPAKVVDGLAKGSATKAVKGDGVQAAKKTAKGDAVASEVQAANVAPQAVVPPAVVNVATAAPVLPVKAEDVPVQAAAEFAVGAVKGTKVAGAGGAVKGSGSGAKKVESDAVAGLKQEAGSGAEVAFSSGAGGIAVKESVAAVVPQTTQGVDSIVAAATTAGHGTLAATGSVTGKTSSSGDVLQQPISQAAAQESDVKTLAATTNVLEVGIESGTHGWLRVRAEMGQTGEIAASMVAASAGQADTLRRELPAISTYLAGESVGVSSLVVNATEQGAGAQDAAMNFGAAMQGGSDSRAQQGAVNEQAGEQGGDAGWSAGSIEPAVGLSFGGANLPAAIFANGSGNWLSVRV